MDSPKSTNFLRPADVGRGWQARLARFNPLPRFSSGCKSSSTGCCTGFGCYIYTSGLRGLKYLAHFIGPKRGE